MLTKKQQIFLDFIITCYKMTQELPTIGFLKKNSNYKSYNTIYKYLEQLEKKEYIKLDEKRIKVIYIKGCLENNQFLSIPIINDNRFVTISNDKFKSDREYIAFRLTNNKLNSYLLKPNDILIFEKNEKKLNNKFVLVLKNNKYQIFKYIKKDGFIHLKNDINLIILSHEVIIGKCVYMIRDIMD
ncbi:MAG: hypothetical protein IJ501_04405 [Bacilli bacterium]|nr:hypothetical protein [Bacilli bacterium]